jgi:hypothetical protein
MSFDRRLELALQNLYTAHLIPSSKTGGEHPLGVCPGHQSPESRSSHPPTGAHNSVFKPHYGPEKQGAWVSCQEREGFMTDPEAWEAAWGH